MRVLRTILGMLMLTLGLPSLLGGATLWAAMQHRDPGGAFSGELQRLYTPGYAFVVPDVDRLLRTDAPFARFSDTQLRINARTQDGPAFVGLAPTAAVEQYLYGVPHSTVRTVDIGTGALPVATTAVPGRRAPGRLPGQAAIWLRTGTDGHISWSPGDVRGGPYSLVVMNPGAKPGLQLGSVAELRAGWLDSSSWGLITLGTLLLMIGLIVVAWPGRRREVVYVVEPSQVPELMAAIGAPLPINHRALVRPVGAHRPRTLADTRKAAALPAAPSPQLEWPPLATPALATPALATPALATPALATPALATPALATPALATPALATPALATPALATPAADRVPAAVLKAAVPLGTAAPAAASVASAPAAASVASAPAAASVASAPAAASVASAPAAASVAPAPAAASVTQAAAASAPVAASASTPAPGKPLNFIKPSSAGGSVSLGDPRSPVDPLFGRRPERGGRRAPEPSDLPLFQASAVGAWVAETAPERARQAEATAAARMAEVARKRAAAGRPSDDRPGAETNGRAAASQSRGAADTVGSGLPAFGDLNPAFGDKADADAAASAYAAGAADARVAASRADLESAAVRDPRTAGQRVAVVTGPKATDWASNGLARADSARRGRRQATSGSSRAGGTATATAAAAASSINAAQADSPASPPAPAATGISAVDSAVSNAVVPAAAPAGMASTSTPAPGRRVGGAGTPATPRSATKPEAGGFPEVLGLGRSSVAGDEPVSGGGPGHFGRLPDAGRGGHVDFAAQSAGSDRPELASTTSPAGSAVSSADATTAPAGSEPPLSASRARQAAGAGTGNGRDDRRPVSAPALTSTDAVAHEQAAASPAGDAAATESSAVITEPNAGSEVLQPVRTAAGSADVSARMHAMARGERIGGSPSRGSGAPVNGGASVDSGAGPAAESPADHAASPTAGPSGPASPAAEDQIGSTSAASATADSARSVSARSLSAPSVSATTPTSPSRPRPAPAVRPEYRPMPAPSGDGAPVGDLAEDRTGTVDGLTERHQPGGGPVVVDEVLPPVESLLKKPEGGTTRSGAPEKDVVSSGRLLGLGPARPTPAAWRKAAESVAARAAATAEARAGTSSNDATADASGEEKADVGTGAQAKEAPAKSPRARAAKASAPKASAPKAASDASPEAPVRTAKVTSAAVARSAARSATSVRTDAAPAKPAAAAKTAAAARPATKPATSVTRLTSYQKEAAELLAASAPRRRRRMVTEQAPVEPPASEPTRRGADPALPDDDGASGREHRGEAAPATPATEEARPEAGAKRTHPGSTGSGSADKGSADKGSADKGSVGSGSAGPEKSGSAEN